MKTLDPSDVPEVKALMDALAAYDRFKGEHSDIFEHAELLAEVINQKLEAAEHACRTQGISCGPIKELNRQVKWDAEGLLSDLGRERFIQVGGKLSTQTVADVDKNRLEASLSQGLIPSDVSENRRKEIIRYKKPKPIQL